MDLLLSHTMKGVLRAVSLLVPLLGFAGCSNKLETGYEPRRLGSSNEVRRGYYAAPFSPEARKAKEYENDFGSPGGPPKPGY
jgi:hypothetical protein